MHKVMQRTLYFAVLLLPLMLTAPVHAQTGTSAPAQPEAVQGGEGEWSQDQMKRQEYREEMEKIRAEHEDLESEHDQLKTQCMNAKGQDRAICQQKWQNLHQRKEALHTRVKALREKMEADHISRHHGNHHTPNAQPQSGTVAAPAGSAAPTPAPAQ